MGTRIAQILAVLVPCLSWLSAYGQGDKPSEYQVKAAFLYNFANFVEWPATAFPDSTAPFVIGILGEDPFGDDLVQIVKGESVGRHKIEVRHLKSLEEIGICHILYATLDGKPQVQVLVARLKGSNTLSVGDIQGFADMGGIIGFVTADNRVRFEVNISAAMRSHLTVSSKLQKVATRIIDK